MKKPLIAITTNFTKTELEKKPVSAYATAVEGAGGTAVLIPKDFPRDEYTNLRKKFDGLLLTGGGDVDIRHFNGEPNSAIGIPSPLRDELELALARLAIESGWPLLGICRGIQVLNIALGGTLITDIPSQYKTTIEHNTPADKGRQFLAHDVQVEETSSLARIMRSTHIKTNSFHHQAIKQPAVGLIVTARTADGLIEAVEIPGSTKPVIGVQWHPENLQEIPVHKALFMEFINACM